MKHILMYAPTAPSSGITQYILNMLERMDQQTFAFDIASFQNPRLQQWATRHGGQYIELNISPYKHPVAYKRHLQSLFSRGYDVVHFHCTSIADLRPFRYAKKAGTPQVIVHSHNTRSDLSSFWRRKVFGTAHTLLRHRVVDYADTLCACSYEAAQWMFGIKNAPKAILLKNAIDEQLFAHHPDTRQQQRQQLGIGDQFVVGHVGRFSYQKNHEFLLDIFVAIKQLLPDAKLLLVGSGETMEEVRSRVEAEGLKDSVIFIPFSNQIHKLYQAMDVFVLPSRFEGLPFTLIESQASGTFCFVSDAVTESAKITEIMRFLPLQQPEVWAKQIVDTCYQKEKYMTSADIIQAGYSLHSQVEQLAKIYAK